VLEHLTGDVGAWLGVKLSQRKPAWMLDQVVAQDNKGTPSERAKIVETVLHDPAQLAWFRGMIESFAPLSSRETGARVDLVNEVNLPDFSLKEIAIPTLVIHGTLDSRVPVEEAAAAAALIPGAQFLPVQGAGHLVFLGPDGGKAAQTMIDFLKQHTAPPPEPPEIPDEDLP